MNQKEFDALETSNVIRYIGKSTKIKNKMSFKLQEEGITISGINSWDPDDITIYFQGHYINNPKPKDWERVPSKERELADARYKRKQKRDRIRNKRHFERAKEDVPDMLSQEAFFEAFTDLKESIDWHLEGLEVGQKMEILSKLKPTQRLMLEFSSRDEEEVKKVVRRIIKEVVGD